MRCLETPSTETQYAEMGIASSTEQPQRGQPLFRTSHPSENWHCGIYVGKDAVIDLMPVNGKKGVDNNCIIRRVSLDEFLTKNGERRGIDWGRSKRYLQEHGIEETQERLERVAQNAEQYREQYCHEGWPVQYRLTQEGGDNCNSFIDKCCEFHDAETTSLETRQERARLAVVYGWIFFNVFQALL